MIKYNDQVVDVIKLLQAWRDTFEENIKGDDYYYNYMNKNRDEDRLLRNLQIDAQDTISNLFEMSDIPKGADIYEE
jgi:hypothetical protein